MDPCHNTAGNTDVLIAVSALTKRLAPSRGIVALPRSITIVVAVKGPTPRLISTMRNLRIAVRGVDIFGAHGIVLQFRNRLDSDAIL